MTSNANDGRRGFLFLFSFVLVALLALLALNCDTTVPRQGWSERWGPMVPHSTFPGDCSLCHVADRWDVLREDFEFDHVAETGFALTGAHLEAACLRCHNDRGPVEAYVARGCGGCHPDPHKAKLGLDCTRCHTDESWRPSGLVADHARTRFPLVGQHVVTPCEACHLKAPAGDFRGAPTSCEICHRADIAGATPDHAANGWVTDCARCHTPVGWDGASVRHDFFPLTAGHGGLECTQCHVSGNFTGVSPDCYPCHQEDYQRAPGHVAQQFSRDCRQCHGTSTWEGGIVQHDFFPLVGGHGGLDCVRCHTTGQFGPIPSDCYSCHRSDYEGASRHVSQGYPRDCTACHTTSDWGSSFSHRFALSGPHNVSCIRCHEGGITSTFTCLVCHEHRQSAMDDKHREERGYRYDSQACYECHPDGRD